MPLPGGDAASMVHSADVDIDLGRGLAHAKEWLENNVFKPGHKTNQSLVYALLYSQGILPRYTLDPAPSTTARAFPALRSVSAPEPASRGRRLRRARGGRVKARATRAPRKKSR